MADTVETHKPMSSGEQECKPSLSDTSPEPRGQEFLRFEILIATWRLWPAVCEGLGDRQATAQADSQPGAPLLQGESWPLVPSISVCKVLAGSESSCRSPS